MPHQTVDGATRPEHSQHGHRAGGDFSVPCILDEMPNDAVSDVCNDLIKSFDVFCMKDNFTPSVFSPPLKEAFGLSPCYKSDFNGCMGTLSRCFTR